MLRISYHIEDLVVIGDLLFKCGKFFIGCTIGVDDRLTGDADDGVVIDLVAFGEFGNTSRLEDGMNSARRESVITDGDVAQGTLESVNKKVCGNALVGTRIITPAET